MAYSLGEMFIAEMLAMSVVIGVGEGVIANEVLKRTKGHDLGFGMVAIAFGLAFYIAIYMFGNISATVNPAMLLAKALVGKMPWRTALALMVADFIGAFLGAVYVYGVYFAHFSLVPTRPVPPKWNALLVNPHHVGTTATRNNFISYEPDGGEMRKEAKFVRAATDHLNADVTSIQLPPVTEDGRPLFQRHNSIQVATLLHSRDPFVAEFPEEKMEAGWLWQNSNSDRPITIRNRWKGSVAGVFAVDNARDRLPTEDTRRARAADTAALQSYEPAIAGHGAAVSAEKAAEEGAAGPQDEQAPVAGSNGSKHRSPHLPHLPHRKGNVKVQDAMDKTVRELHDEGQEEDVIEAYRGALLADRNAKLTVFATRPAVFNYKVNFVCEMLGTFMLIWSALTTGERALQLPDPDENDGVFSEPILVGWLVVALVMALGGPTGYAANPARDCGPRFAHWVLPIPNKGPSEWYYSWVPICATYLGGFLGGCLFAALREINQYPEWSQATVEAQKFGGSWR